jgi:peroxiredoxin
MKFLPFIGGIAIAMGLWMPPSTYTLHGNITGLETGWVFMYHHSDGPVDSATINHGRFELTGKVTETEFCHLVFRKVNGANLYSSAFFLEAGTITATGNKDSLASLSFTGAPVQDEYRRFLHDMPPAIRGQPVWQEAAEKLQAEYAKTYAAEHPASYVAVEEVLEFFSYDPNADTLQHIYNGLAPQIQSSYMGKELKQILDATLLTGVGRPAPGFTQADTKGNPVALSSYKGQYVLIDFWASWCGPCRLENPGVVKTYRHFHSKGFTVLGVSLDEQKDKWLAAIRQDGMPWTQVSDLKGWKNDAAVLYGVEGIPMNYLVDRNGTIVGRGLRGQELDKKLEELVH